MAEESGKIFNKYISINQVIAMCMCMCMRYGASAINNKREIDKLSDINL